MAHRKFGRKTAGTRIRVYKRGAIAVRGKRAKRYSRPDTMVSRARFGIGDQLFCKLKYWDHYRYSVIGPDAAGNARSFQSSLRDPDLTGIGTQPQYFDQIMALYSKFQCLGMKVVMNISNASVIPALIGYGFSDTIISATSVGNMAFYKYFKTKQIAAAGGPVTRVVAYISAKKIHGQKSVIQMENEQGTASADPVDRFYFYINVAPANLTGADTVNVDINTEITYYTRFSEQQVATLS